ncbi:RNA-binding domain-containing protein [Pseudomonas sp. NBRC 100443]|uniref:AlbA family DNA-binding domain-containing protein n=1 Tax=Pseudomonas sp. NBRC 100443 TaxID=1113665 RepID=UPI0024A46C9B|nr:RNA-binding domain-containing protein [Pseudomonas sp. NBRC 100443]GLU41665.1 hypothetical protein Pssp01_57580 [Pseudomonas sp. NBRC 100443]
MISKEKVRELLLDVESDRTERTISTTNKDKFCEAICSFANDFPNHRESGYLFIGAKDDGTLNGQIITDEILRNLGGIRSEGNILPQPAMTVSKYSYEGGEVAVVEVHPSDLPPVRYKGRTYIRVGPRKAIANEQEERILTEKRIGLARSFDSHPCVAASLADLALNQFIAYRDEAINLDGEEDSRSIEMQMASLRLFDPDRNCPTNAGILLFGSNPIFHLPGAYIQYLEMPGTDLTELPTNQAEISGDLRTVLTELETRLRSLITRTIVSVSE